MTSKEEAAKSAHWKLLVLMIYFTAKSKNITHDELAQRAGVHRSHVTRVFGLKYCPSLDIYIRLTNAVGLRLFMEDMDEDYQAELNDLFEKATDELNKRVLKQRSQN